MPKKFYQISPANSANSDSSSTSINSSASYGAPPHPIQQQQHHHPLMSSSQSSINGVGVGYPISRTPALLPEGWDVATDNDGKIYYIDHNTKSTTWIDPRDRFTKPTNFADCVGDELPLGWEEAYDNVIGRYYINHINQSTQLEDPRQEWKGIQEAMLKDYLVSAQDSLDAKREIYDVKQRRLMLAQDEYNVLNALAASRNSLSSSTTSISSKYDPELLKADLALSKERVRRLKQELAQINSEISFTQRGVATLYDVEQKLSAHENGCYNIAEVQQIREEMVKIQKSLNSGEREKEELKRCLTHLKQDLSKLQYVNGSPMTSSYNLTHERVCTSSQTDLCADIFPLGEVAKTRLQYEEWKKRIKDLQQQLADHVEKIEPGQLEADRDRLMLIQEKEQLLKELQSMPMNKKSLKEQEDMQLMCKSIEADLSRAYEISNQNIANQLRVHEEKQSLLQQLQDALRSTKMLEERLKSLSSGSTFSISSSSSFGSLSTASSKGSLSGLSFTDIYGDPLAMEQYIDMSDLQRKIQRLSHPSELSLSPRSSLSVETPPSSPMKETGGGVPALPGTSSGRGSRNMLSVGSAEEPTYENTKNLDLNNTVLDCVRLEERLYDLEHKQNLGMGAPLSPIFEKPAVGENNPNAVVGEDPAGENHNSRSSSMSNTRSVSAAVSNESVAGDSGVFEASRTVAPNRESAQIKLALRYIKPDQILNIQIERARNLWALFLPENCDLYFRLALLPSATMQTLRTANVRDFEKPAFNNANFSIAIPLNKVYTKTLQISAIMEYNQRDECVGSAQISLAEFNGNETTIKWYNVLSFRYMPVEQPQGAAAANNTIEVAGVCKEESSDESTIISSQTSTLTRNQPHDEIYESLINKMNGKLNIDSDDDEEDEDDEDDDAAQVGEASSVDVAGRLVPPVVINRVNGLICDQMKELGYGIAAPEEDFEDEEADRQTEEMLAAYMESVQNYVDKETNTECGFLPEKALRRIQESAALSSKDGFLDDRIVKRSQTFSPSAVVSKNRYVCRLNRSDSDSAMHFVNNGIGLLHPFQRNSVERRSLRLHNRMPKVSSATAAANKHSNIPRTSLDLELDYRAQHTKLETLNDELAKLRDLKQKLEMARDANDAKVAAWALENEDFQRLVNSVDLKEDKKLQKLLHKKSKEIYKLRKTRLGKGQPDVISFKEKMAFFTRLGHAVPEVPHGGEYDGTIVADLGDSGVLGAVGGSSVGKITVVPAALNPKNYPLVRQGPPPHYPINYSAILHIDSIDEEDDQSGASSFGRGVDV